ncbi:MAG: DNA replication and repair protein RecF [Blastocatellia bacterium]|nr:DNA replication and repair protein RecF [Blastocatellia bacterium]
MLLERLKAHNFRNLSGEIAAAPGLNILIGENGQGKTNWLEAIALLASTRSFRTAKLSETIRFGERLAVVSAMVEESPEITRKLQVAVEENKKTLSINDKKEATARYFGQLHAIVFNSDALEIVRGQPEGRRDFLDTGIVSLHPPFVQTFADYARVIKQKNALLQGARGDGSSIEHFAHALSPWNEQLATHAARIYRARVRYVERLNEVLQRRLFGKEEVSIRYVSSLEGKGDLGDYSSLIAERLAARVHAELIAGYSLIGPHRDDLEVLFDGHDLRKFGSAGQQRSAFLLLQLANISVFHATRGEYPVFLIDDIDAELDYKRIARLLEFLDGKTQTFVTTSKAGFVEKFGLNANTLEIVSGLAKSL